MLAKLTVIGLYNYDNTLFDGMSLPNGIVRNTLIDTILNECSSFAVVHPDPVIFKRFLNSWSTRRVNIWSKLLATTEYEYDPIANYDRTEEHSETVQRAANETTTVSSTGTTINTGTVTNAGSNGGTTTEQKTAFNSDTLATTGQEQYSGNHSDTTTNNLSESNSVSGSDQRNALSTDTITRRLHAFGNIGVTTTQQMIDQERAIDLFDIYAIILSDFIETFCVQVY